MGEAVPPKENLDFFKELNNYYSPFAHLINRRNGNKKIYETHNGIKINFDEKNGYFGKQATNKNLIKTNISKTKLIKKISSRDFKMKLANESHNNSNISNGDIKLNFRPSENNLSIHTNNIIDLIFDDLITFEEQVRDLFRTEQRRQTFRNDRDKSERLKTDLRRTNVLKNVPHFNPKNLKNKKAKKKLQDTTETLNTTSEKEMVKIFDQDFDKVFNIMLGINRSIYWLFESPYYQINDTDYTAKFEYNNQWYSQTGENDKIFTFTDYAPKIFENIRKLDGIKNDDYSKTLGPSNIFKYIWSNNMSTFKALCSSGKSGSLFYYTEDGKYMLKTIHKDEFLKMREIIKPYHEHIVNCNNSVINRFYGLHKINYFENRKEREQYLVIMNNLFGIYEVDIRYDLKGSTSGRTTFFPEGVPMDKTISLKDNNFIDGNIKFNIEESERKELLKCLDKASKFLGDCSILDYSLLVGVVDLEKRRNMIRQRTLDPEDPIAELLEQNPKRINQRGCFFSVDRKEMYILGIIDTLTNYTTK